MPSRYIQKTAHVAILALLCIMLPGVLSSARAQRKDTSRIKVIATVSKSRGILLRWSVNTAVAWKLANQYGFELLRYTVVRDGKLLQQPELKKLSALPLKPQPLPAWENIVQHDSYAAVIAQALYGKDFEVSAGDNSGIARIINQSQEQEQRFALSMYAADNSFEAAKMAGWAWEDNTAQANEKYLYRLHALVPPQRLRLDSAGVFIGMSSYQALPRPRDLGAIFSNRHVILSWDYSLLKNYYSSWIVERSTDGKTFERATALPVTNFNEKKKRASPRMYFIDSLKDNNTIYYYRIRGISAFNETGPPSDTATGKGRSLLAYVPNIRSSAVDERGVMELTWEFEEAGNPLIKGFRLNQGPTADGPFTVAVDNIAPAQRAVSYNKLRPTNYFTITAIAKEGEPSTSFPVLVQPVDSIPPEPPAGLAGTIDSNGVVTLTWQANKETDLLGYKVFRAHQLADELSPLVDSVYSGHTFRDSVAVQSLNSRVYYAVTALDKRYNQSRFSAILEIKKPDVIPPSAPVFSDYKVANGVVNLKWVPSRDADVAMHLLYRRHIDTTQEKWQAIATFNTPADFYADRTAAPGNTYAYLVLARDSSGLESKPTQPVTVTIPPNNSTVTIRALHAMVNREQRYIELSWSDNLDNVLEYHLYKGEKGGAITLWKISNGKPKRITDSQVNVNTTYVYGIKAILKNGAQGAFKTIDVMY